MTWLLEMKNITKTFGAVKAVDNVSLRLTQARWSRYAVKMGRGNRR